MAPAEVAHPVLSRRQHVLQIPAQELCGAQSALLFLMRGGVRVTERHRLIVGGHDTVVADGGASDVASEILDDVYAGTGRLGVYDPPASPHPGQHRRVQRRSARAQCSLHPPPEHGRQLRYRQEPVWLACPHPLAAAQSAAGYDEVNVRLMLELAAPGVEHADN